MRYLLVALATLLPGIAHAQDVTLKPLVDARLRYEHVDQQGVAEAADALTLRVRPGLQGGAGPWSALIEAEATLAIVGDYHDGLHGQTRYPLIVDPQNIELNRAQFRYAGGNGFAVTAGRQLIELADQRFVGSSSWRQNQQTFDAVRAQWGKAKGFSADLAYAWSDRTVNGIDGNGARPQAIGGDNIFAVLGYGTRLGTVSGFAYLVDQDAAAVQGFRLSSQTWGVRFAGSVAVAKDVRLGYVASWARQRDWHRNPNDYAATYWLGEANLTAGGLTATAGYEVLGADRGVALTSVQTPLASFFKWNGWAGKFNPTPPDGLRDFYAMLGHGWKKTGPLDAINLAATWHRFDSDRQARHYGDELDLVGSVRRGRAVLSARWAHYDADAFATDTDKLWLSVEWAL